MLRVLFLVFFGLLLYVQSVVVAFVLGAFTGVHCPTVNHYAGGTGAVEWVPPSETSPARH